MELCPTLCENPKLLKSPRASVLPRPPSLPEVGGGPSPAHRNGQAGYRLAWLRHRPGAPAPSPKTLELFCHFCPCTIRGGGEAGAPRRAGCSAGNREADLALSRRLGSPIEVVGLDLLPTFRGLQVWQADPRGQREWTRNERGLGNDHGSMSQRPPARTISQLGGMFCKPGRCKQPRILIEFRDGFGDSSGAKPESTRWGFDRGLWAGLGGGGVRDEDAGEGLLETTEGDCEDCDCAVVCALNCTNEQLRPQTIQTEP